eukprot:CAMPEP_0198229560 /NCGR_PEP_ID=MMETSP1445-20131203/114186_1 /TAXON_ID=36898 /ORGANISM="Pyramimonas sp., Strain CCMP2087" /LENGTH=613 /DNA_ID=CAMNT_0043910023 /DNA_START=128 /DNA_END=1969 /DNA_ORIENTATION=-
MVNNSNANSKFTRNLAHTEVEVREKAFKNLTKWLQSREDIPALDMLRIWKGLFYAFWHSDLQPVQADLADRLANIILLLDNVEVCEEYFGGFLSTMRREWFGIDKLRLDKYMMLVRTFLTYLFRYLGEKNEWEVARVEKFMSMLLERGLLGAEDLAAGIGFNLHLADVFAAAFKDVEGHLAGQSAIIRATAMEPFIQVLARHPNETVLKRVQTEVFEGTFSQLLQELPKEAEEERACIAAAQEIVAARARQLAEDPDLVKSQKNRRYLYEVCTMLSKKKKKAGGKRTREEETEAETGGSGRATQEEAEAEPSDKKKKKLKKLLQKQAEMQEEVAKAVSEAIVADAEGKKKKKKKRDSQPEEAEEEPVEADAASKKKKKKKKLKAAEAEAKVEVATLGTTTTPASEWSDGVLADDWDNTAGSPASVNMKLLGAFDNASGSPAVSKKKKKGGIAEVELAATPASPSLRKRVTFRMKQNLEFHFNAPPHPPEARTPKGAQPKGPALKAVSKWPNTPQSAPAKRSKSMLGRADNVAAPATEAKGKKKGKKARAEEAVEAMLTNFGNDGNDGNEAADDVTPSKKKKKSTSVQGSPKEGETVGAPGFTPGRRSRASDFF